MTRQDALIALLLAATVLAAFGRAAGFGFIGYDDPQYVTENPPVASGLTWHGVKWALTTGWQGNWHPLTWLSHMVDCQVFGLRAGWHHIVNVLLHAGSSILVFLVFRRATGARWESAFAAALFALHPLRVESVAWVSERKDVLSVLLFMLTLWSYVRYAERPRTGRYAAVLAWYALGLLAKPMLVTTPFVLLLMDYWPLRRSGWRRLVLEKIPLMMLAAGISVAAYLAQRSAAAIVEGLPISWRLGNAVIAYTRYLAKTCWPTNLAVFYPLAAKPPAPAAVIAASLLLASMTAVVIW